MMFLSGLYNHAHSSLALRNCNKLVVHDPFLVLFHLDLVRGLEIQHAPSSQLGRGLTFMSASDKLGYDMSLTRSYGKYAHCGLLTCRNYKTTVGESVYTSATNDSCQSCAFLPPDRLHSRSRVSYLALPVPLISTALVPLLPSSSQILDNDPYHGPGLCILCTILPHAPLTAVTYPASSFSFPNTNFVFACGFVELLTQGLV